jgi:hypothetical protein
MKESAVNVRVSDTMIERLGEAVDWLRVSDDLEFLQGRASRSALVRYAVILGLDCIHAVMESKGSLTVLLARRDKLAEAVAELAER